MKTAKRVFAVILLAGLLGGSAVSAFDGSSDATSSDNATFVSQNVPSSLQPGESRSVSITMRNTGTTTWHGGDFAYKLGSQNPQDNNTWGFRRIYLQGADVRPGSSATFTKTITAPATPGIYNFQWRLVHDAGIGWFGPLTPNVAINVGNVAQQTPTPTSCPNPPTVPTFNPYPISYSQQTCTDYPLISARVINGGSYNTQISAKAGDEIFVRIYVHNGAADNLSQTLTTARNVRVSTQINGNQIKATASADNAASITGTANISIPSNAHLEVIPGSGQITDRDGIVLKNGITVANTTTSLGDMKACYPYLRYVYFKVRVVAPATDSDDGSDDDSTPWTPPSCPPASGTVFQFPNNAWLLANSGQSWSTKGPYNFNLPAGTYNVRLTGADDHREPNQIQPNEQYRVVLKNASGAMLATSGSSPDIADSSQIATGNVGQITIAQNASTLTAVHSAYPSSNPNSVLPICAVFERVDTGNPSLSITKLVRNLTRGEATPVNETSAVAGETVRFRIEVTNTGTANATNVLIRDVLPAGLTYVAGSTTKNDNQANDGITTGNYNVFTLTPGQKVIMAFNARVESSASGRLTNTARTSADGVAQIQDTAFVNVQDVGAPQLTITKLVRNETQNSGETDTVSARPHDIVEFVIRVRNTGNANAVNVRVWDVLPAGLAFISGDNVTGSGMNIGTLTPGQQITLRFRAQVREDSYFSQGTTTLTNIAYANANNVSTVQDSAWVNVQRNQVLTLQCSPASQTVNVDQYAYFSASGGNGNYFWTASHGNPSTGSGSSFNTRYGNSGTYDVTVRDSDGRSATCRVYVNNINQPIYQMTIQKLGTNVSKGETVPHTPVSASPNDTLDFTIKVRSTSSTTLNNVIIRDTLPAGLQYVERSTSINGTQTVDGIVSGGINIGSLAPNQEVTIRFNAVVRQASYFVSGVTPLTNYAYTRADNVSEISAHLPVNIFNGSVLGDIPQVPYGASGLTILSIVLVIMLTMGYMAYTQTGVFRKREAWSVVARSRANKNKFNFVV